MAVRKSTKTTGTSTADAAAPEVIDAAPEAEPVVTKVVRRKEFVDRIVANSGMKPNAIKTALDAFLKEIGDALSAGEALNLPALGRVSVNRRKELDNGEVLICKIRRRNPVLKTVGQTDETSGEDTVTAAEKSNLNFLEFLRSRLYCNLKRFLWLNQFRHFFKSRSLK